MALLRRQHPPHWGPQPARKRLQNEGPAYNPVMLHSLAALLTPAIAERLTLWANHLLAAESVATEKMRIHAGRTLVLRAVNWPSLLPPPPALAWRVTAAGLLEWCTGEPPPRPDLAVDIEAGNPALLMARMLAGERPAVQIEGDAQFASDVNWLLANLRWDVAADLERLFGPVLAQQLHQLGSAAAAALRTMVTRAADLGQRWRPDGKPGPS